jgi:uncharacterized protein YecT (DUF1311 family)
MKYMLLLLSVSCAILFSGDIFGQCDNAGTNAAITNCMSGEYQKADAELNRIYKLAFKGLNAKEADNLKNTQRAWIAYRDGQCDAEYAKWEGGSGGPAAHLACLYRLTQLRTRELHKTYRFQ